MHLSMLIITLSLVCIDNGRGEERQIEATYALETSNLLRFQCYDCYQYRVGTTDCTNCLPCQTVDNQTSLYSVPSESCYVEHFIGFVFDESSEYHGQPYVEWTRSGSNNPASLPEFVALDGGKCEQIVKEKKIGNAWENSGMANVRGCLHVNQCFDDKCNRDDMATTFSKLKKQPLVQLSSCWKITCHMLLGILFLC